MSARTKPRPGIRALNIHKHLEKVSARLADVRGQANAMNYTLGNASALLSTLKIKYDKEKKVYENVTYIYKMKVQQLKVATYEKKRSEMEVDIRKNDLDIVTDTFRKVCEHVEETGAKITLEHKCCLAYVVDCPGTKRRAN